MFSMFSDQGQVISWQPGQSSWLGSLGDTRVLGSRREEVEPGRWETHIGSVPSSLHSIEYFPAIAAQLVRRIKVVGFLQVVELVGLKGKWGRVSRVLWRMPLTPSFSGSSFPALLRKVKCRGSQSHPFSESPSWGWGLMELLASWLTWFYLQRGRPTDARGSDCSITSPGNSRD